MWPCVAFWGGAGPASWQRAEGGPRAEWSCSPNRSACKPGRNSRPCDVVLDDAWAQIFHDFTFVWTNTALDFFLDGVHINHIENERLDRRAHPFNPYSSRNDNGEPLRTQMRLNLAVPHDTDWNRQRWPILMEVDYTRYYIQVPAPPPPPLLPSGPPPSAPPLPPSPLTPAQLPPDMFLPAPPRHLPWSGAPTSPGPLLRPSPPTPYQPPQYPWPPQRRWPPLPTLPSSRSPSAVSLSSHVWVVVYLGGGTLLAAFGWQQWRRRRRSGGGSAAAPLHNSRARARLGGMRGVSRSVQKRSLQRNSARRTVGGGDDGDGGGGGSRPDAKPETKPEAHPTRREQLRRLRDLVERRGARTARFARLDSRQADCSDTNDNDEDEARHRPGPGGWCACTTTSANGRGGKVRERSMRKQKHAATGMAKVAMVPAAPPAVTDNDGSTRGDGGRLLPKTKTPFASSSSCCSDASLTLPISAPKNRACPNTALRGVPLLQNHVEKAAIHGNGAGKSTAQPAITSAAAPTCQSVPPAPIAARSLPAAAITALRPPPAKTRGSSRSNSRSEPKSSKSCSKPTPASIADLD